MAAAVNRLDGVFAVRYGRRVVASSGFWCMVGKPEITLRQTAQEQQDKTALSDSLAVR